MNHCSYYYHTDPTSHPSCLFNRYLRNLRCPQLLRGTLIPPCCLFSGLCLNRSVCHLLPSREHGHNASQSLLVLCPFLAVFHSLCTVCDVLLISLNLFLPLNRIHSFDGFLVQPIEDFHSFSSLASQVGLTQRVKRKQLGESLQILVRRTLSGYSQPPPT